jgi:hypothetical protein
MSESHRFEPPKLAEKLKPRQPGRESGPRSNGWTPERRARQAEMIRKWKPWEKSTGPKTAVGKSVVAQNYLKSRKARLTLLLPALTLAVLAKDTSGLLALLDAVCDFE